MLDKEFFKDSGITLNEAIVVYSLSKECDSCASYLSDQLGLSNSRTSKILLNLERKRYIKRKVGKEDKRLMLFSLTEKGMEKKKELQRNEDEYIKLTKLLAKFIN
ncbi:MAG: MarR family winged helix-turn-helix transcriptional regulator [Dysgonomonas sp.]